MGAGAPGLRSLPWAGLSPARQTRRAPGRAAAVLEQRGSPADSLALGPLGSFRAGLGTGSPTRVWRARCGRGARPVWEGSGARPARGSGEVLLRARAHSPLVPPGPLISSGWGERVSLRRLPVRYRALEGLAVDPIIILPQSSSRWPRVALRPLRDYSGQGWRGREVGEGCGNFGLPGSRNPVRTAWASGASAASRGKGRVS